MLSSVPNTPQGPPTLGFISQFCRAGSKQSHNQRQYCLTFMVQQMPVSPSLMQPSYTCLSCLFYEPTTDESQALPGLLPVAAIRSDSMVSRKQDTLSLQWSHQILISTEMEMSSWWNFPHWLQWMLSFWQLQMQPKTKKFHQNDDISISVTCHFFLLVCLKWNSTRDYDAWLTSFDMSIFLVHYVKTSSFITSNYINITFL